MRQVASNVVPSPSLRANGRVWHRIDIVYDTGYIHNGQEMSQATSVGERVASLWMMEGVDDRTSLSQQ